MYAHNAPKPNNFDELSATWDDPAGFAVELARYYAQLSAAHAGIDITVPRRGGDSDPRLD